MKCTWKLKKLFHVRIFVIKHFYLQGSHFKYLLLNYNDNEKKDLINEFRDLRERERVADKIDSVVHES